MEALHNVLYRRKGVVRTAVAVPPWYHFLLHHRCAAYRLIAVPQPLLLPRCGLAVLVVSCLIFGSTSSVFSALHHTGGTHNPAPVRSSLISLMHALPSFTAGQPAQEGSAGLLRLCV